MTNFLPNLKKNSVLSILLAILIFTFTGCKSEKTLYLYCWTYYIPDSVVEQFEKEFNVDVKIDNYASNEEMFAKLKAGAKGYDVIFPSQDYASIMIKQGMFHKIDNTQFTNRHYVSELVRSKATYDPDMEYAVPYYMGCSGVIVNKTKVPDYEKSWTIFERKDLANRMVMMDDMREVMGDALKYNGYSVNSLDPEALEKAAHTIAYDWKPNIVKFDAESYAKGFASGDFWVVQGYAESIYEEIPEEKWDTIDFFVPKEGGTMYIDSMCIPKKSSHFDLAMQFINFIHRPQIYAMFCDEFSFPPSTNIKAGEYMTVEPLYTEEILNNCEIMDDLGENLAIYNKIWQEIRYTE
ncbi:MAG: spermidine/putrescine ABC transporter substrate-binding protein [Treponema sp. CETP13]|nr:MAG: spermidine/putrescine ABC transporter substrate-binding protein [Treponema sp. CETP13]